MLSDITAFVRYAMGLPDFLRQTISLDEARENIQQHMENRKDNFLRLIKKGVYENPGSPYKALLKQARLNFSDIDHMVKQGGIESTLTELYEEGVYITLDEFKGRHPIKRPGFQLSVHAKDFDNPLLARHYNASTGGSRGAGTRLLVDFDLLEHEACSHALFLMAFDIAARPTGLWRPLPPGVAGMKNALRHIKLGKQVEQWFTQNRNELNFGTWRHFLFTNYVIFASRLWRRPLPIPKYSPLAEALQVARWLAAKKEEGTPAHIDTSASAGVRVCLAAKEHCIDISGTLFRFGGEPFTPAKAKVVADTGCHAVCHYSMGEAGHIGIACAAPATLDDVHLLPSKMAVIQREKPIGKSGNSIKALIHTTLFPGCPKIMLNVESGDYGEIEERSCGCLLESFGLRQHLHTIRSYEKLTSEGMCFTGSELITLIEDILPTHFGGNPTDYQFVEQEENGLPKVSIVVSPRVGGIDEPKLTSMVLETLRSTALEDKLRGGIWEEGHVLRVMRREVYSSGASKILPLHILSN